MTYRVDVDESLTTAVKGTDFDFESERTWPVGKERDTLVLKLIKTPKLDNQMFRVVLKVTPTTNFEVGPTKNARSQRVIFTSKAIAPAWWDAISRSTTLVIIVMQSMPSSSRLPALAI